MKPAINFSFSNGISFLGPTSTSPNIPLFSRLARDKVQGNVALAGGGSNNGQSLEEKPSKKKRGLPSGHLT